MNTEERRRQKRSSGSVFRSIKGRISLLLIACIIGVVVILLFLILPNMKNSMRNLTKNYLYDITVSAGERVALAASESGMEAILDAESLRNLVGSIGLEGGGFQLCVCRGIGRYHAVSSDGIENRAAC